MHKKVDDSLMIMLPLPYESPQILTTLRRRFMIIRIGIQLIKPNVIQKIISRATPIVSVLQRKLNLILDLSKRHLCHRYKGYLQFSFHIRILHTTAKFLYKKCIIILMISLFLKRRVCIII